MAIDSNCTQWEMGDGLSGVARISRLDESDALLVLAKAQEVGFTDERYLP